MRTNRSSAIEAAIYLDLKQRMRSPVRRSSLVVADDAVFVGNHQSLSQWTDAGKFPHFLSVSLGVDDEVGVCMADEYLLEEIRWEQTVGVHCFT